MGTNRILRLTGQGELRLYDGAGHYTRVRGAASLSGNVDLVFPASVGAAGQFLQSDGSGVMVWAYGSATLQSAYDAGPSITVGAGNPMNFIIPAGGNYFNLISGADALNFDFSGSDWIIGASTVKALQFRTSDTSRLVITAGGDITVVSGSICQANATAYKMKDAGGTARSLISINAGGNYLIGDATAGNVILQNTGYLSLPGSTQIGLGVSGAPTGIAELKATAGSRLNLRTAETILRKMSLLGTVGSGADDATNTVGELRFEVADQDPNPLKGQFKLVLNSGDSLTYPFVVSPSGFVGIGDTTPGYQLSVWNTIANTTVGYICAANDSSALTLRKENAGLGYNKPVLNIQNISPHDSIYDDSGAKLTAGGIWTDACAAVLKENFEEVDAGEVLEKVTQIPIKRWTYKKETSGQKHMGPVAEDFHEAFGLGDSKGIAGLDLAATGLVAIQALVATLKEKGVL